MKYLERNEYLRLLESENHELRGMIRGALDNLTDALAEIHKLKLQIEVIKGLRGIEAAPRLRLATGAPLPGGTGAPLPGLVIPAYVKRKLVEDGRFSVDEIEEDLR
jgi:hypothetical protein